MRENTGPSSWRLVKTECSEVHTKKTRLRYSLGRVSSKFGLSEDTPYITDLLFAVFVVVVVVVVFQESL